MCALSLLTAVDIPNLKISLATCFYHHSFKPNDIAVKAKDYTLTLPFVLHHPFLALYNCRISLEHHFLRDAFLVTSFSETFVTQSSVSPLNSIVTETKKHESFFRKNESYQTKIAFQQLVCRGEASGRCLQGATSSQRLHFVDFDSVVPMSALHSAAEWAGQKVMELPNQSQENLVT